MALMSNAIAHFEFWGPADAPSISRSYPERSPYESVEEPEYWRNQGAWQTSILGAISFSSQVTGEDGAASAFKGEYFLSRTPFSSPILSVNRSRAISISFANSISTSATLRFGPGIDPGSLSLNSLADGTLIIGYGGGDTVGIVDGQSGAIENFEFEGGIRVSTQELIGQYSSTPLAGTDAQGNGVVLGGAGSDALSVATDSATLYVERRAGNQYGTFGDGAANDNSIRISA